MIWIRGILLSVSLIVAVVGAVTAYTPRTNLPDEQLVGLHLNAAAIARVEGEPASRVVVPKSINDATALTAADLDALRQAGIERVRVKEFSFSRWTGIWLFLVGSAGLAASAGMKRLTGRPTVTQGMPGSQVVQGPDEILDGIIHALTSLQQKLGETPGHAERLELILTRLDDVQRNAAPAFIAARAELVSRLGLSGYAQLMDSFAAAERQINRAWSAAADDHESESRACLDRAHPLLITSKARMQQP